MNKDYRTFLESCITNTRFLTAKRVTVVIVEISLNGKTYKGEGFAIYNENDARAVENAKKNLKTYKGIFGGRPYKELIRRYQNTIDTLEYDEEKGYHIAYGRAIKDVYDQLFKEKVTSVATITFKCSNCNSSKDTCFSNRQLTDNGIKLDALCTNCGYIEELLIGIK